MFSGDGEHGNPERESVEMLFDARGTDPFAIHLTYPIDKIDVERKKDWDKEQGKERTRNKERKAEGKPQMPERGDWSPKEHSHGAFFDGHPLASGQTLHVVPAASPHVIDLLDPLGF